MHARARPARPHSARVMLVGAALRGAQAAGINGRDSGSGMGRVAAAGGAPRRAAARTPRRAVQRQAGPPEWARQQLCELWGLEGPLVEAARNGSATDRQPPILLCTLIVRINSVHSMGGRLGPGGARPPSHSEAGPARGLPAMGLQQSENGAGRGLLRRNRPLRRVAHGAMSRAVGDHWQGPRPPAAGADSGGGASCVVAADARRGAVATGASRAPRRRHEWRGKKSRSEGRAWLQVGGRRRLLGGCACHGLRAAKKAD